MGGSSSQQSMRHVTPQKSLRSLNIPAQMLTCVLHTPQSYYVMCEEGQRGAAGGERLEGNGCAACC